MVGDDVGVRVRGSGMEAGGKLGGCAWHPRMEAEGKFGGGGWWMSLLGAF